MLPFTIKNTIIKNLLQIEFICTPSHTGFTGNEGADKLKKMWRQKIYNLRKNEWNTRTSCESAYAQMVEQPCQKVWFIKPSNLTRRQIENKLMVCALNNNVFQTNPNLKHNISSEMLGYLLCVKSTAL